MKTAFTSKVTAFVTAGVAVILLLMPFYAFLTVWPASVFGHYTLFRLWKELLLVALTLGAWWLVYQRRDLRRAARKSWLLRLMAVYVLLQVLLGLVAVARHQVNGPALAEGLIQDARLPVIFFVAWAVASRSGWLRKHWQQLVLWPGVAVAVFAVLQFSILPHNFLSHFGYNAATTIAPIETINHNSHYIRVQSTLRGANQLGAYLVIILSVLGVVVIRSKRRLAWLGFSLVTIAALYVSGSRSAWLGTVVSLMIFAWLQLRGRRAKLLFGGICLVGIILAGSGYLLFKNNTNVQNEVLHTQTNSSVQTNSNAGHTSALKQGLRDVLHEPLGRGPGTAGPASAHNLRSTRYAENYFLQIGQETGWLGLTLFLVINILLGKALWIRRTDPLALALFAGLIGLSLTNLFLPAWTDDTLAYIWWSLAGIALAVAQKKSSKTSGVLPV